MPHRGPVFDHARSQRASPGYLPELRPRGMCRCSGDDAVNIAGSAAPVFRGCKLQAKRCGVRAFDSAKGTFDGCKAEECGEQGVKLMEKASLTFSRCTRRLVYGPACIKT